ncbi:MAG: sterol desaturase family protein [Candidatus Sericytochromatia bacterium]
MKLFTKISLTIIGLIYLAEKIYPNKKHDNQIKHDISNVIVGIENRVINQIIVKKTYSLFDKAKESNFGLLRQIKINSIFELIISLLIIDLFMYWWHRLNHENDFLYKFHNFHHLEKDLNSTSAIKFHFMEITLSSLVRFLVLLPLGIDKKHIDFYEKILSLVIAFNHSNIKISNEANILFNIFIVSPKMHRIHHSDNIIESNSNYSSVLPIWDIVFNSYTP